MMKFRVVIVVLFIAWLSPQALAFIDTSGKFLAAGDYIPRRLEEEKGYVAFGALNLRQFRAALPHVRIEVESEDKIGDVNGNGRKTAHWSIDGHRRTIWFNPFWLVEFGNLADAMSTHEYLGVMGFDDEDYVPTLGLWFLAHLAKDTLHADETDRIREIISGRLRTVRFSGGVIGVGGGGQMLTIVYRASEMVRALKLMGKATNAEDREKVFKALLILWSTADDVTYSRGANPSVEFSLPR